MNKKHSILHIFGFKLRNLLNNAAMLLERREECGKKVGKHTPVASQSQTLLDLSSFITSAIKLKQDFFQAARRIGLNAIWPHKLVKKYSYPRC